MLSPMVGGELWEQWRPTCVGASEGSGAGHHQWPPVSTDTDRDENIENAGLASRAQCKYDK